MADNCFLEFLSVYEQRTCTNNFLNNLHHTKRSPQPIGELRKTGRADRTALLSPDSSMLRGLAEQNLIEFQPLNPPTTEKETT